ncbi:hypothetical protein JOH51_006608 [Rhizobium leguminosarum]|nr:hypothetical protein [Rhizobium leguminosarum]
MRTSGYGSIILNRIQKGPAAPLLTPGVGQGIPSVDDGNHGKSGFLRSAKECGTRCLCWDITLNGIEARSYRRDVFLAIVGRPCGDKSLGNLTERSDQPMLFLTAHDKYQRSEIFASMPIHYIDRLHE